jgi:hypothetical protein
MLKEIFTAIANIGSINSFSSFFQWILENPTILNIIVFLAFIALIGGFWAIIRGTINHF